MHRLFAEGAEEPQALKVKETVDETLKAEFARAVLALLVMHRFLAYLCVAGVLGKVWNVPVHLSVNLYALYDLLFVCLEAAVHVVQLDAGDHPCSRIVELARQVLGKLVVLAVLLPSADYVIIIHVDHTVKFRNLVWRILQVGIHRYYSAAFGPFEPAVQRSGLAVVAPELNTVYVGIGSGKFLYTFPGTVSAAVVNKYHLIGERMFFHHPVNPLAEFRERFAFVEQRYNNGNIYHNQIICYHSSSSFCPSELSVLPSLKMSSPVLENIRDRITPKSQQ